MKFALGKREEKTEQEIKREMSMKSYNPASDPLMPRLFRKVSHQTSVSQRGAFSDKGSFSKEVSVYDNETSMMGKEKHTLV